MRRALCAFSFLLTRVLCSLPLSICSGLCMDLCLLQLLSAHLDCPCLLTSRPDALGRSALAASSASMAAELCVPGCLVCQFRPCPACRGDALCELCWTDLQDILWVEEWEAEGGDGADGDFIEQVVGAAVDEAFFAGSPTTCPPTSDTDVDFAEAASPDS